MMREQGKFLSGRSSYALACVTQLIVIAVTFTIFSADNVHQEVSQYIQSKGDAAPSEIGLQNVSTTPTPHNSQEEAESARTSEMMYISDLLFNGSGDLSDYFLKYGEHHNQSMEEYIPLRMDYLQRSRVVLGDTTNLRQLLYRIIVEKQCITVLAIGGSVTFGSGGVGRRNTWCNHLRHWLNNHPLTRNCKGKRHEVLNRGKGGWNTINHYYQLPEYFGTTKWEDSLCADIDVVIFETSPNDSDSALPIEKYFEMTIRNLLLCRDRVPVILSLESVRGQGVVMKTQYGFEEWNHWKFKAGDLRKLALLNYYQIPSVSLSNIIYPLAYRYHMNYHYNESLAAFRVLSRFYEEEDVS